MHLKSKFCAAILYGALAVLALPNLNHNSRNEDAAKNLVRRDAVKEAFKHSWDGYVKYAWGADELRPVSNTPGNSRNGWGATIIDAMDTAILMDLNGVVMQALEFVPTIDFSRTDTGVSLFETTIRYLGGMISAHDLLTGPYASTIPKDKAPLVAALLKQSIKLADSLKFAFNTKSGIPANNLDLAAQSSGDQLNSIATIGTLVLEWTRLSDLTGDSSYTNLTQRGEAPLLNPKPASAEPFPGLITMWFNIETGEGSDADGGWGAGDDSYYEYLLKMFIYDADRFAHYGQKWLTAAESTLKYLKYKPLPDSDMAFIHGFLKGKLVASEGHLTCFVGGNFLLGGHVFQRPDLTVFGLQLTDGCHHTYATTPAKIGPESFSWDKTSVPSGSEGFFQKNGFYVTGAQYQLRPETIESYYHAWRLTGDKKYQEWAWDAFLAINRTCRTPSGFSSISNVMDAQGGSKLNTQESFWFAETLKYLWLIFGGGEARGVGVTTGKQEWVFNTEAHPIRVRS
ncbi:glycoside hydrolase [Peziza echinospora]|nr:glycoside hydrolase [Peziza echinospora]